MTAEPGCPHAGRIRPVVWVVGVTGSDTPNTVVCEQCWKVIGAGDVAHTSYREGDDGWYYPQGSAPDEPNAVRVLEPDSAEEAEAIKGFRPLA